VLVRGHRRRRAGEAEGEKRRAEGEALGPVEVEQRVVDVEEDGARAGQDGGYLAR